MSPSRSGARPLARRVLLLALALLAACGGGDDPAGPGPTTIEALGAAVRAGEPLELRVRPAGLAAATYAGTMNGDAVTFVAADDSTLFTLVPESLAEQVRVVVTLGRAAPATTVAVAPARTIADPRGAVTAAFDRATAAAFADTLPTGADAQAWAADSVKVVAALQQVRSAIAALSPAEQLTLARIVTALEEHAGTTTGALAASTLQANVAVRGGDGIAAAAAQAQDEPCVLAADAWKAAATAARQSLDADQLSTPAVGDALVAYGALRYMVAYSRGAVGVAACRYPTDYQVDDPRLDDDGTTFTVSAIVRTLQDADRLTTLGARQYFDAKTTTVRVWNRLVGLLPGWAPVSKAAIPEPPASPRLAIAPQFVDLEFDRVLDVTGLPSSTGGPNGSAPATVRPDGARVRLDVRARIEDRKAARVEFVFTPGGVEQRRTLTVPVQRCEEQQRWFQRCSYGVKIEPDDAADFVVGGKLVLTGRVYAKDLTELFGRRVTWSRGSNAVALSTTTGATTTVTALAQTSAASVRAEATDAIRGVAGEEFYRIVGWNINYTWLGVTGYAELWDTNSPSQPIVRYGAPVRLHVYWINSITKAPLIVDYSKLGVVLGDAAPYVSATVEPDDTGAWVTFTRTPGSPEMNIYARFSYEGQAHTGVVMAIGTRD